jgi:hypothetical protein
MGDEVVDFSFATGLDFFQIVELRSFLFSEHQQDPACCADRKMRSFWITMVWMDE